MNFWQGRLVRLRGVEPSDAETFALWNLDSEAARTLDFVWPPVSLAFVKQDFEQLSLKKLEGGAFFWVIEDAAGTAVGHIATHTCDQRLGVFRYGLSVAAEHRRRGYAAEAVLIVLKYYFEELRYQKCPSPSTRTTTRRSGFTKSSASCSKARCAALSTRAGASMTSTFTAF